MRKAIVFSISTLIGIISFFSLFGDTSIVYGQSAEKIRKQIEDRNQRIEKLEKEIKQNEIELQVVGKKKQTLKHAVQELDITRKKVSTDITLTVNKIGATNYTITQLESNIQDKESGIENNQDGIAESLRALNRLGSNSLLETILANGNISDVWDDVETLRRVELAMRESVKNLKTLKKEFEREKLKTKKARDKLNFYKQDLSGQKRVLDQNKREKDKLLQITKSRESGYQQLLKKKRAARVQFEQELQDLESQLKFTLDKNSIPPAGQGIFEWPLDTLTVTQFFGNTAFAKSGAYSGKGHNGVDFRASPGTRVKATLGGTVEGTGNTDRIRGCYSYGKWILLKHNNGLSTLYAHLSVINVDKGEVVATGQIIGYSGNSGYSTGPHLHLTTYLSDAVQIVRLGDIKKITNCGPARIPVAPFKAYLNPLDYLRDSASLR